MDILLVPDQSNPNRQQLVVDGVMWCFLHRAIFGKRIKFRAKTPDELQQEILEQERQGARRYLLYRLSKQGLHSAEAKRLLSEREVSTITICDTLGELRRLGYLNDEEWLSTFVSRCRREKKSARWMEMKLRSKHISESEISSVRETIRESTFEKRSIEKLLSTTYAKRNVADYKEKQKVIASLVRKGFAFSQVIEALDRISY